ncbi:hypothetical protein ALC53_11010 [Atta colombica]|uniref:Uncharacterized protein n=1 Tax=Atta colombica TaxID=520822 RepID=A0A195B243_9HYME|nr:hypothetical protein ALC53_11010 [Atta colombica]
MKIRRCVGWCGIRNGLFAVFAFFSCSPVSQSGRNQRRRTLRKKTKERQDIRWEPFLKPTCKEGFYDATYF